MFHMRGHSVSGNVDNKDILEAVLTEYAELRADQRQHIATHLQLIQIFLPSTFVFAGLVINSERYELLHLLPLFSFAFVCRLLWEQAVIRAFSKYLEHLEVAILPKLIGHCGSYLENPDSTQLWLGWQRSWQERKLPSNFYRYSMFVMFVLIPFGISLVTAIVLCGVNDISFYVQPSVIVLDLVGIVWCSEKVILE